MIKSYPLTPEKFLVVCTKLGLGAAATGTFSPSSHPEITLGYTYANSSLQVTILHEAWYETAGEVWDALDPYFV